MLYIIDYIMQLQKFRIKTSANRRSRVTTSRPLALGVFPADTDAHDRPCAVYEQGSEVLVAPFADAAHDGPAARGLVPRHQAKPG